MGIERHRSIDCFGEQAIIPAIDIACTFRPSAERVPKRPEPVAAIERDRMNAFVLPKGLGRLAFAVLEGVEAIARSRLQVERFQKILNRRIFGSVADKYDLES